MMYILLLGQYVSEFYRHFSKKFLESTIIHINSAEKNQIYDYVVLFGILEHNITIRAKQYIFISGEPQTLQTHNLFFLKQFNKVFLTHTNINIKSKISKQILPWHLGISQPERYNYESFYNLRFFNKTKIMVAVTSNKNYINGHIKRNDFIRLCKFYFKSKLDVYGRGIHDFKDKIDFLPKYKYNVVIENSSIKDYYTEKFSDSVLANCYTFYYGCKNIKEYFPENSYTIIDINNPVEALKIIEHGIVHKFYEKNINNINISKNRILHEYNIQSIFQKNEHINKIKTKHLLTEEVYMKKVYKMNIIYMLKKIIKLFIPYGIIYLLKKTKQ